MTVTRTVLDPGALLVFVVAWGLFVAVAVRALGCVLGRLRRPRVRTTAYPNAIELCRAPSGTYDGIEGGRPFCPVPCPHSSPIPDEHW